MSAVAAVRGDVVLRPRVVASDVPNDRAWNATILMKSESRYTRELCAKFEACGASVLPIIAGAMGRSGWPDRYVAWCDGDMMFHGWIEFKSATGKLRPNQVAVIRRLEACRVNVFVVRFFDSYGSVKNDVMRLERPLTEEILCLATTTRELLQALCRTSLY